MADDDLNIKIGGDASGMEAAANRGKQATDSLSSSTDELQKVFKRVKQAIDPTYAALERYNRLQADNAKLLKEGVIQAADWANMQVRLRQLYDEEVSAIQRRSNEGKKATAERKAQAAMETAAAKEQAAAEKLAAREAAAERKAQARAAAQAEREARQQLAAVAREQAAAEKQAAREAAAERRTQAKAASDAERTSRAEATAAARAQAAAEKQAARDATAAKQQEAKAAREAAAAEQSQAKAERQSAAAIQEMRASIDPAFAAQSRYNQTMRQATVLLMDNKLKAGEWIAIQRQAKMQMDVNMRSMGRFNTVGVQLGYQMQDVAASIASGINPLVILAQQGGQTASALSMMGGKVGAVAAILGGIWVQAALAAIIVCAQLWGSLKEGKEKTLDLDDAESRRTHTVRELTDALRDYVKAQRERNNQDLTNLTNEDNRNAAIQAERTKAITEAQRKLNEARRDYDILLHLPAMADDGGAQATQLLMAAHAISKAEKDLRDAQDAGRASTDALTESRVKLAQANAEATAEEKRHQTALQEITDVFRKSSQTQADYAHLIAETRKENERFTIAKEKEAEAHRENAKAIRDEAHQIFQSRQAAIGMAGKELQKEGYNVGENNQFGGIHGYHPGMGNSAHGQFAIDINIPGVGEEAYSQVAKDRMDKMVAAYQARGFRILWNGKVYQPNGGGPSYDIPANENQHTNHVHMEAPQSIVGKPASKQLANELIADENRIETAQERAARKAVEAQLEALDEKKAIYADDFYAQLQVVDEKEAIIKQFYGVESKEAHQAAQERIHLERQISQQVLENRKNEVERKLKIDEAAAERENELAKIRLQSKSDTVDFNEQNNLISPQKALAQRSALLEEEYQQQVIHENKMYQLKLNSLREELLLDDLPAKERDRINGDIELLEAQHLNTMSVMYQTYARNISKVQLQSFQLTINKWKDMVTTIGQAFSQVLQGMWMRSMSWKQAMINVADAIVFKFMDMGIKMLEDWIVRQAIKMGLIHAAEASETAAHVAGETARTGVTATGVAARASAENAGFFSRVIGWLAGLVGIHIGGETAKTTATVAGATTRTIANKIEGLSAIATAVGLAGANGVASWALAPWPIDAGAPAFGAAMAATAAGLGAVASAARGQGRVPFDGQMTELHRDEMVLPSIYANPLRDMLTARISGGFAAARAAVGGSSSGKQANGDVNLYYQPKHHNMGASFDTLLKKDGASLRKWIKNEARNGRLTVG
jgi:hypothetical protein